MGTNWDGELPYDESINQDIFNTKNLTANWGDSSPQPLVNEVPAAEKYRELYAQHLEDYVLPANRLFLWSEYEAKFD
ncbi:MAG: hypothetical protein JXP73_02535 [Deltaproteobacteria bacterium]|nr:hypothetical protein [Deltaproteobacteria bacterium]